MAKVMIQRNHRFWGELFSPGKIDREKGEQDEQEAEAHHEAERDEGDDHGRAIGGREVVETFHRRVRVVVGEEAEPLGDLERLDGVVVLVHVRELEDEEVGALFRIPLRFHGGELRGLVFRHLKARHVTGEDDADRGHDAEGGRYPEGFLEHFLSALAQQVDGRDAHDEKRGKRVGGGDSMEELDPGVRIPDEGAEGDQLCPARHDLVAARLLHPAIREEDPERRERARQRDHPHDGGMRAALKRASS